MPRLLSPSIWHVIFGVPDMQFLIVALLIGMAVTYLIVKFLPAKAKQMLIVWMSRQAPGVMWILPAKDCSGGCSSCGVCADIPASKNEPVKPQKIRFFPNTQK